MKKSELKLLRDQFADRNAYGTKVRHAILAYAYLRGVPYRDIESVIEQDDLMFPKTARTWFFNAKLSVGIHGMVMEYVVKPLILAGLPHDLVGSDIKLIRAWITVPESEEHRVHREAHHAAHMEEKRLARANGPWGKRNG